MNESDNSAPMNESPIQVSRTVLPDLRIYGYQVYEQLSERDELGKIGYLGIDINLDRLVVIKEWCINPQQQTALDYANYLPVIERLQQLDHSNIPRYLNSFATPTGFCVVREYQSGVALAELGDLPPSDIKLVASEVLKILADLHRLQPMVIHQNIKPENIIVNSEQELSIYLVDFGLNPQGGIQPISVTPGFMPPEQLFNLDLVPATDIYSLGVSLICLLTGTPTPQAQQLLDDTYHIQFQHLLPANTDPNLIAWLQTMVESNRQRRSIDLVPQQIRPNLDFDFPAPKPKFNWIPWAIGTSILLGLALIARQFIFPDDGELSPAQIAKNQQIAQKADFEASDRGKLMREKQCTNCNFNYQNFSKAELPGSIVSQSSFSGANFGNANMSMSIFRDADLSGANFSKANLQQAAFYGAKLIGTNLVGANLSNAKLVYAKLKGAWMKEVNLSNADLKFADAQQVDLTKANLTGADLSNADFSYTNLRHAILVGAKLNGTNLTGATMPDGSTHR
jgi:uncharacterized protein YjbI with pentapeptide repeats